MPDTQPAQGHCLCGKTSISVGQMSLHVGACHCGQCRRWTGGPLLATDCGTDVTLAGDDYIGVFRSSDWAERGFCTACGSHLFYRLIESRQYFVPVGLFEDGANLVLDHQVFIDEKPAFYAFANPTRNLTGTEAFAQFEADADSG
uniref:GFA family protein n=1 Tax=Marinobacterium profundum TaxID=1714300 RepID=UPI0008315169|nr:GFA family protein [Marinobacterium profundum]